MKQLWITPLIFLLPAGLASGQQPASKQESSLCRLDSLPTAIQHHLKQEYGSWRVQEVANLSQRPGQSDYEAKLLDKLDEDGAANYFLRGTPIGKFFDQASKKRFNAHTSDVILLFDSAEKEYEVDVYYWSEGHYRHDPVDY